MSAVADGLGARFAAAGRDSELFKAALFAEEVAALAYAAAADGPLAGEERELAVRFAGHERQHAAVFATMLFALTVPVREHAGPDDLDALLPGLRGATRREALEGLAAIEGAAIAGHQLMGRRLEALDALRSVAMVTAGAAQHLAVIRRALGYEPVARAFETGR